MRVVALDVGDRKVGVAAGDTSFGVAFAQPSFPRTGADSDFARLARLCEEHGAERALVGLPLNSEGGETEQSLKIRDFARRLESVAGIPVEFRSEALTTRKAREALAHAGRKRRQRAEDSVAAAMLLQEYLDEAGAQA